MQTTLSIRAVAGAICTAAATLLAAPAQAALQDRDLNGDSVVDAFYDTDLDITWLRDANVNGLMDWVTAVAWADGYSFGGYNDWRLPTSDTCYGAGCTGSEMGHLWYVELGNPVGGPFANTGGFQNFQSNFYWSNTVDAAHVDSVYFFDTSDNSQYFGNTYTTKYALLARPGDVPAVPEPQSFALLLLGLSGLAVRIRTHRR